MNAKHIVILAGKDIDRSAIMDRLVEKISCPKYGFITRMTEKDSNGYRAIYLYKASDSIREKSEANHIGNCNGKDRTVNTAVFDTLGLDYLKAADDGVIIMDELGFMEIGSEAFCNKVLACLDGDIPVLASAKDRPYIPFLNRIRNHPNVQVFDLTSENSELVFEQVSAVTACWKK